MRYLQTFFQQLTIIQWTDILDIILVAFLIYKLLPLLRSTGAMRVARVIAVILVISWLTGPAVFQLNVLNFLVNQIFQIGLIAVVVLFQPEIRRMLDHLSTLKLRRMLGMQKPEQEIDPVITQTVRACEHMSHERIGALIVFSRVNRLEEYFKTGTMIDGRVSEQLIRNVFFPKAALHDGAMIIRDGRVMAAGCVLPLSDSDRLHADLGTRHRAAVGMSEVSDAVVVVVSEETGAISVAVGGILKRHLAAQTLERVLRNELRSDEIEEEGLMEKIRKLLHKNRKENGKNEK
ncbi:MAG: diadenylate cyclase CdaA [Oscillospiraceae bacterium]|nr:diadenylate cyclase CdaA [Oscillospiraceae bacterium]